MINKINFFFLTTVCYIDTLAFKSLFTLDEKMSDIDKLKHLYLA